MYQPSGISTLFWLRRHSPSTRAYTRAFTSGPTRIGLPSGTSTVRAQPIIDARTSTTQTSAIQVSIDRHGATLHAALEPREEREGDLRDDALEHVT